MGEELSIHIESWGRGDAAISDEERGEQLCRFHDALERRGARGAIAAMGGIAAGPAASFGLDSTGGGGGDIEAEVGRAARKASRIFLAACVDAALSHGGIARVDVQTISYLERSLDQPAETFAGVSEVAELLGVSRQRINELRHKTGFPAPAAELASGPVWRTSTLRRFLDEWERKPGRPRKAADA